MVGRKAITLFFSGLLLLWATTTSCQTESEVQAPRTTERFVGFSVQTPPDGRWRLVRDEQKRHVAVFQFEPFSPTHSFNATIMIRGLPTAFETKEAFLEFVNARLREESPRFERLSLHSELTESHGQWAVRYRARYLDKSPVNSPSPLLMRIVGILYLHPYMEGTVIDAFYSERGREEELDGSLDAPGEAIISGTIPEAS